MYTITNWNRTEDIEGTFYEEELTAHNSETYKIDKILKHRTRQGRRESLILWVGHKVPTWELSKKRQKPAEETLKKRKQFYMYAFSNAAGPGDDANSLTKFSNSLSEPLIFSDRLKWKMCIRSLFMSNAIASEFDTDFVQVRCDQLSESNGSEQIISLHSKAPTAEHLTSHAWIPRNAEWFHPISNYIEALSFTLLNNHSQQLQLKPGHPTIILLEFKQTMSRQKEFFARVSSRSTLTFLHNKPNDFTVSLPVEHSFFAQCPFEIAVSSITYTPSFQQIYWHQEPQIEISLLDGEDNYNHHYIPIGQISACSCDAELIFILNQAFASFHEEKGKEDGFAPITLTIIRRDDNSGKTVHLTCRNDGRRLYKGGEFK